MAALPRLDDDSALDAARVGAKAAALAKLRRRGLPVPDGFVLPAGEAWDVPRVAEALGRLGGPVAVRSSSTAEDLAEASFAGQYETTLGVLGVEEVLRAAEACRQSAPGASAYAHLVGAPAGRMAVLVQEMVEPTAAGAAFSRSPRHPERVLVEAVAGRGDRLMAGAASADRYELDPLSGARLSGPTDGCLDASACAAVFSLLKRVEDEMGGPQDVEWALRPGAEGPAVVLLQARPITTQEEPLDPALRRLTRANIGEVLPDPVTPLTWSTIGSFLEHGFRTVLAEAGLLRKDTPPVVVRHLERLYLNLSLALEVAARLPLVSPADAERLILGSGAAAEPVPRPSSLQSALTAVRMAVLGASLRDRVEEAERLVESLPSRERIASASSSALAAHFDDWLEVGRRTAVAHILSSGASGASLALLTRLVGRLAPGDAAARVSRLTAGLEDVESAAPAIALEALASRKHLSAEERAWIEHGGGELASAPGGLGPALEAFLKRFGHRALGEGELRSQAWEDDPTPVLEALRGLVHDDGRAARARRTLVETRRAEEEALLGGRSSLVAAGLRAALGRAQAGVRQREHTKSLTVRVAGHGRRIAKVAARRLVAEGRLANVEDVFLLEGHELRQALVGGATIGAAVRERRRRRLAREGALDAPREVDLQRASAREEPATEAAASSTLSGLGVSPGLGRGPVRRLRPGQPHPRLQPGDVLVAPVLDAALGPLLASAAGAVAEMGGVLSHGSVVARELGVPCVVEVRQALAVLQDGDRVEVDGDRGEVRRLERADENRGQATATETNGPPRDAEHLVPEDTDREAWSPSLPAGHRESVYFNLADPSTGLKIIATVGVRAGGRGECVIAIGLPDGRVLFGLDRARAGTSPRAVEVAGTRAELAPVRLQAKTRLAPHEGAGFPPAPFPLLLAPRTVEVELDLAFELSGPAIDFCRQLSPDARAAVSPVGDHHLEQSGRFVGRVKVDGREWKVDAGGSRDHSWGQRDWSALDYSRLFVARFGDDLAVQALRLSVRGQPAEGGFLWRGGRAERVARVAYSVERSQGAAVFVEVEVRTAEGGSFTMRGPVERTLTVPVDVERRPFRHLRGRPYALLLQENFVRWEAEGRSGLGVAEISVRP